MPQRVGFRSTRYPDLSVEERVPGRLTVDIVAANGSQNVDVAGTNLVELEQTVSMRRGDDG